MTDEIDTATKSGGAWGQAVTAVALVGALGVGLWAVQQEAGSTKSPSPATCSGGQPSKPPQGAKEVPGRVYGAQLCAALTAADLPGLMDSPGEVTKSASGSDGSIGAGGDDQIATSSARVELGAYTVTLSASYDRLTVATYAELMADGGEQRTVMGRPAYLSSDRTMDFTFRFDGGKSESRPGVPARVLIVARDAQDSGGSYEVAVWRKDGMIPDDAMLLRLAEQVLPTLPGWTAAG